MMHKTLRFDASTIVVISVIDANAVILQLENPRHVKQHIEKSHGLK